MRTEFIELLNDFEQWLLDNDYEITEEDITEEIKHHEEDIILTKEEKNYMIDSLLEMVINHESDIENQIAQLEYDRWFNSLKSYDRIDARYLLHN